VNVHVRREQLVSGQADLLGDTHVADVAAAAGRADRLHHRLLGADRLEFVLWPSAEMGLWPGSKSSQMGSECTARSSALGVWVYFVTNTIS
jgi:hypothetical protein